MHDRTSTRDIRARPRRGEAASLDFAGEVIAGSLPCTALVMLADWAQLHEAELSANWDRARRDEPLEPIDQLP